MCTYLYINTNTYSPNNGERQNRAGEARLDVFGGYPFQLFLFILLPYRKGKKKEQGWNMLDGEA
jgi:hypothetical protein